MYIPLVQDTGTITLSISGPYPEPVPVTVMVLLELKKISIRAYHTKAPLTLN